MAHSLRITTMRAHQLALLCLLPVTGYSQKPDQLPTASAIMAQVAAHQDQSEAERAHFLYVQHADVTSRTGKTIRCREITDTRITPGASGSTQTPLKLDGEILIKGKLIPYSLDAKPPTTGKDADDPMDIDLVENMRNNLIREKSKDGTNDGLFPLTSKIQAEYTFTLVGRERVNGRDTFHLTFTPKDKDAYAWKGDAYIDTTAYQPVLVRTKMSRQIPFAVRTLLGTSVPHLGFTVIYAPQPYTQPDGSKSEIWFPISFGTEFKLHVLFFLNRDITMNVQNREFQRTKVTSTILTPGASSAPSQP
jgi:hypothetical protein